MIKEFPYNIPSPDVKDTKQWYKAKSYKGQLTHSNRTVSYLSSVTIKQESMVGCILSPGSKTKQNKKQSQTKQKTQTNNNKNPPKQI